AGVEGALSIAKVQPMTTARALRGPFDYRLPEGLRDGVDIGSMLVVPFGRREVLGVVVGLADSSDIAEEKLLAPLRVLDEGPPALPVDLVALAEWIAAEYCSTIARALALVLPPGASRRLSGRKRRAVERPRHLAVGTRSPSAPELTDEQAAVLAPLIDALDAGRCEQRLLHGVTGSGKTEVYLRAAASALEHDRGAIMLVPPIEDLGLIVVDEEHDASYKHEGDPRYDARDVAAERARRSGAVLLLGSATPRAETVHRVPASRLARRVDGRPLPAVRVLDMRGEQQGLHPLTAQALAEVRSARGKAI